MHAYGVTYGSNNSVIDEVVDDAMDLHLHVLASGSDDLKQCFVSAAGMADRGTDICRSLASNLALAAGIPPDAWRTQATQRPMPHSISCTETGPRASPHRIRSTSPRTMAEHRPHHAQRSGRLLARAGAAERVHRQIRCLRHLAIGGQGRPVLPRPQSTN